MIIGIDGNEANVVHRVGSNQYAFELLHALNDLPDVKKHEWIIYLREKPLPEMPKETVNWKYKVFGPKRFWTQLALPFSLLTGRKRPNVFFTPGHYRPRWSPVPTVVSIMDLGYLRFPEQFTRKDLIQLTHWTSRSIENANHILTISESTRRDVMEYYDTPKERITVTYPGYDKTKFKIKSDEQSSSSIKLRVERVKRKYGIKNAYILFLSTLKPSKNIEGLLEAFASVTNNNELKRINANDLQLVVAGKKGWLYESIFRRMKDLGLEDKVIFTDFVPEEDVPTLMAGAKVFVLPSFWEGFGFPVVEAMAVGTPVVVSNVGSLPEIVGKMGVLVNPRDPGDIARGINYALKHPQELSKKGLARAKLFDWEKCAKQTLGVLENVANTQVSSYSTPRVSTQSIH